jgi:predicted N-acetyltransferase YhbS
MFRRGEYEIRFAESAADFEQIHRLNYQTFVQEIPQHPDTGSGSLIDKHHAKNRYLLCLRRGELVGMLSCSDQPPFSVESRLQDPSLLLGNNLKLLEIRLLAVIPEERGSAVLAGLVWQLYQHARFDGITHFVISGVESQEALYRHLGFEPLGPAVGDGPRFTPMWLPLQTLEATMGRAMQLWEKRLDRLAKHAPTTHTTDERPAPRDRAQAPGDPGG